MKFEEYLNTLRGKSVAVIGIGVSNRPLIELLLDRGVAVTACDRKDRAALGDLAAALDVSVNELLAGQSSQCRSAGYAPVKELLNGCSEKQLRIITEVIKSTKAALDKYGV